MPANEFDVAARAMLEMMPWVRVLVLVREPAEHWLSSNYMQPPSVSAWLRRNYVHCKGQPDSCNLNWLPQLSRNLRSLVRMMPRGRVFIDQTESFRVMPVRLLARISDFLGLAPVDWAALLSNASRSHVSMGAGFTVGHRCALDLCTTARVEEMDTTLRALAPRLAHSLQHPFANGTRYRPSSRSFWTAQGGLARSPAVSSQLCEATLQAQSTPSPRHGEHAASCESTLPSPP